MLAFAKKKYRPLWYEQKNVTEPIIVSANILAIADELREPATGEIIHKYNIHQVFTGCLLSDYYVAADHDGKLYVLKIPADIKKDWKHSPRLEM